MFHKEKVYRQLYKYSKYSKNKMLRFYKRVN